MSDGGEDRAIPDGLYLTSSQEGQRAELMLVIDGEAFLQTLTVPAMRQLASQLQREAARIEKGRPGTKKHTLTEIEVPGDE